MPTSSYSAPPRVLVVGSELNWVHDTADALARAGFDPNALLEPSLVVSRCMLQRPALVLVLRRASETRADIAKSLSAFAETSDIPMAYLVDLGDERTVIRSFWGGALDVFFAPFTQENAEQLLALLDELALHPSPKVGSIDFAVEGVLRRASRLRRTGTLFLNSGTGYEGRAAFVDGKLSWADFGPLTGAAALEEMLWTQQGDWTFLPGRSGLDPAPHRRAARANAYVPSVLVVDDDPELRELLTAKLEGAGLELRMASDGKQALQLARERPPDLVLADLDIPGLDGWGLLRALLLDQRTRETRVAILSARDDWRETLRSAHLGAADYISKRGGLEDLVRRVELSTQRRAQAFAQLHTGAPVKVEAAQEGIQWLLRRLAQLSLTGTLETADTWGEYTVWIHLGVPVRVRSTSRRRELEGVSALAELLVSRDASGAFRPGKVDESNRLGAPMEETLVRVCDALNRLAERDLDSRVTDASHFHVDDALYALYREIAPTSDAKLAQAVFEHGMRPSEAAEQLSLTPETVHEAIKEMVRRGVLRPDTADQTPQL